MIKKNDWNDSLANFMKSFVREKNQGSLGEKSEKSHKI